MKRFGILVWLHVLVLCGLQAQTIYSENFDAGLGAWTETGGGASGWFSGMDMDLFGSFSLDGTNMAFVDDDANGSTDPAFTSFLTSPVIDLSPYAAVRLEFDYNFRSACLTESFAVEVFDGAVWVQVFFVNTDDCGAWGCDATTGAYPKAVIDCTPYLNAAFQVRLIYDDGGGCFGWWIGVDNVILYEPAADDLRTLAVLSPLDGCGLGATETVIGRLTNNGSLPQSSFPVAFSVDGGTPTAETFTGTLMPGDSVNYTFTATADLSGAGPHDIAVWTALPSDGFPGNDTATTTASSITPIAAPYLETFDASLFGVPPGWINDPDDGPFVDWFFQSGAVFVTGTGPNSDHTSGFGFYAYVDDFADADPINLISPCVDLAALTTPFLRFWVHSREASDGADPTLVNELHIDIQSGGTWFNDVIPPIGTEINAWQEKEVDLSPYGSNVRVRFRANTDNGWFEHWIAIDDVEFYDKLSDDLAVSALIDPAAACGLGAAETVSVAVDNSGSNDQSGFTLSLQVDGGSVITEPFPGILPGVSSTVFSFAATADLSVPGLHTIKAWVNLVGDLDPSNDTLDVVLDNVPVVDVFPYAEDFESGPSGWLVEATGSTSWALGTPSGAVIGSAPPSTPASINSWVTNPIGNYADNESGSVVSPCFDFSTLVFPEILIDVWWDSEGGFDGANLQYTLDDGASWDNVGVVGSSTGVNWFNNAFIFGLNFSGSQEGWCNTFPAGSSGGWVKAREDMLVLAGESSVRFRFPFGSDGSVSGFDGFAFDNLVIRDKPVNDLAILSVDAPVSGCELTASETVAVLIANPGINDQVDFTVSYQLDGGPVTSEVVTDTLPGLATTLYFFSAPADFSAEGGYEVLAWTALPLDGDGSNDTATALITHVPEISVFPYVQDFEGPDQGWTIAGNNASWELATPAGSVISGSPDAGVQSWITNANGPYNADEDSWVISPCFDFSDLNAPGIALDVWWELQSDALFGGAADGAVLQYSLNEGLSWNRVGNVGEPTNWYNYGEIFSAPGEQFFPAQGWSGRQGTFDGSGGWVQAIHALDGMANKPSVRLRIAVADDGFGQYDGFAFDNIVIVDAPQPFLGADTSFCAGGSVLLGTGLSGDAFLWITGASTPTISVSSSGTYWVRVTDSFGFSGLDTIQVTVVPTPVVDLGLDGSYCLGTALDAGNPGFLYAWNDGSSTQTTAISGSGTYEVVVTDPMFGCVGSDDVVIEAIPDPVADFTWVAGGTWVEFYDVSPGATSWDWDFGDGFSSIDRDPYHLYSEAGTYTVTLTVSNACGTSVFSQQVSVVATGLAAESLQSSLVLSPNPSTGRVVLQGQHVTGGELSWTLFANDGKLLRTGKHQVPAGAWTLPLDFGRQAAGTYLLQVERGGERAMRRLILE